MANEYAEVADIKDALQMLGEDFADPQIRSSLSAASRGIDNLTSRRFWLDADNSSVRYYTPENAGWLQIDDIVDVQEIATDAGDGAFSQAWTQDADYVLEPLNAEADGIPYDRITVLERGSRWLPVATKSVRVTGQFGWQEVPEGVQQATVILTCKLVRRVREAPFGVIAWGDGTIARIARSDPDVMFLVGDYIRNPIPIG